jgi:PAS domain S-box-containing protein
MADITKIDPFIQSSPNPAWLATSTGNCVYANPSLERLTGLSSDQINQADWRSFLHEEERVVATVSWQISLASGTHLRMRVRVRGLGGTATPVELIAFGHKVDDLTELWFFTGLIENDAPQQHQLLEAQIQATLAVIPAYCWYAHPSGALTFVNTRTADYLGLPKEHPLRSGIATDDAWDSHLPFLHPDDREEARGAWSTCLAKGCAGQVRFRVRNAEGGYRWFLSRAEPFRTNDGTLLYWIGVNLDIDDAKRAEDALRASEGAFRLVVNTIPGLIAIMSAEGEVEHVSDRILEYFGKTLNELKRWAETDAVHPDDLPRVLAAWKHSVKNGTAYELEHRLRRADGVYRWFQLRGFPLCDSQGRVLRWHNLLADIDDLKQAEQDLQRSQFYLSEAQRLARMGSWGFNPSGFFDYWSDELFQIYGLDPQQGAPTLERYLATLHPQDRDSMAETINKMHLERCGCDVKKRIVRPDGELRYVRCVGIPVVKNDALKGFLGSAIDITEQELLMRELERREAYLAESQRLNRTGTLASDPTTMMPTYWSKECLRIWDFDPEAGLPTREAVLQRIHPEDRDLVGEYGRKIIFSDKRFHKDFSQEFRIVLPDGTVKHIHSASHILFGPGGEPVEVLGTHLDITGHKRAEQERERLHQLEADLAHINRVSMLGEMAASLAHEIKQPIAAAITSADTCMEWLSHDPPNLDRARAAAARIDKYGRRAAQIIDHIRSLYKKSPSHRELVDLNGIIQEIFSLLQDEAIRYSITLHSALAGELPKIDADRVQLQQVFMNLMINAIESMQESGGELMVKSQLENGQLLSSISDTGVGLPADNADQIFSAFYTTKQQGSGMGLAISRTIVESHGGRLWATANEGRGATFHFTLPTEVQ